MSIHFKHDPPQPTDMRCHLAHSILVSSRESSASFLEAFQASRKGKKTGTTTDREQDFLRAVLVFASAGLDAMLKQLIRDTLSHVISSSPGARKQYHGFIEAQISPDRKDGRQVLAKALGSESPQQVMINHLVDDLTSSSLQSVNQVMRVAGHLDIPTGNITKDVAGLQKIFHMRNQISHEMDVDFTKKNRSRRQRAKKAIIDSANDLFLVSANFLSGVDNHLCSGKTSNNGA